MPRCPITAELIAWRPASLIRARDRNGVPKQHFTFVRFISNQSEHSREICDFGESGDALPTSNGGWSRPLFPFFPKRDSFSAVLIAGPRSRFAECVSCVVYEIPLSCGWVYIGQAGRCLNARLREHQSSLRATAWGRLASRVSDQRCHHILFPAREFWTGFTIRLQDWLRSPLFSHAAAGNLFLAHVCSVPKEASGISWKSWC